jgi:hypothetical protein
MMKLKQINRYLFSLGVTFLVGGVIGCLVGYTRLILYLENTGETADMTVGRFARGLILPHVLSMIGMGAVVIGIIMVTRGVIFAVRFSDVE